MLATALVVLSLAAPASAQTLTYIEGTVRDANSGAPVADVCVSFGPPTACTAATNAQGYYRVDGVPAGDRSEWEIWYTKVGYKNHHAFGIVVRGPTTINVSIQQGAGNCARPSTPYRTAYLPNITKTLGGPDGWQTPFIIQNTTQGVITSLRVEFYRFSDGALVATRETCVLRPGNSYALVPNLMGDLADWSQFSVVAKSYMSDVVAVVNEHAGSGARAEAASYVGATSGARSVFLPNITRRFHGFVTPFIIQNLGVATTVATASFVSFDGTRTATVSRTIGPGRSQFVDPNSEPGLADGTQYAVTVAAAEPLSVVVNTHNDAPDVAAPVVYAANGLAGGAPTVRGPYAVKNQPGVGSGVSTIVVQNLGSVPTTVTLIFMRLGGGTPVAFAGPSVAPRASWAFDPRFVNGDPGQGLCSSAGSAGCLADGEYSFVAAGGPQASLAAVVNVIGTATAAGYSAIPVTSTRVYLPNVTRTLGGASGWTTPIFVQSAGATNVRLSWYRFSDGSLVTTQNVFVPDDAAIRVDPRTVPGLPDDSQFSVVAEGLDGQIAAIVHELNFQGGDGAMTYEGFAR